MPNVRSVDTLEHWRAHGTISEADYDAALRVREAFRRATDGGLARSRHGPGDPGAVREDAGAAARSDLKRLLCLLGEVDKHCLIGVICRGLTPDEAGRTFGLKGDGNNAARRVRQALETIVRHRWGTDREIPPIEIPEVVWVRPASQGR